MARGIFIRESDLEPLASALERAMTTYLRSGEIPEMVEEREALLTLINQVTEARVATPKEEIERDRQLRYEFGDDIMAMHQAPYAGQFEA